MKKIEAIKPDGARAVVRSPNNLSAVLFLRQFIALLRMATEYAAELSKVGWDPKRTAAAEQAAHLYEEARRDRRQATAVARLATRALRGEMAEVRLFRAELLAGLRLLASQGISVEPKLLRGVDLAKSGPKHLEWLGVAQAGIESIAGPLSVHVVNPLGRLEERRQLLVEALGTQSLTHRKLPRLSQQVVEAKARLSADMNDIRSAARIAFLRNPAVWLQFKKKGLEGQPRRAVQAAANDEPASVPDQSIAS